MDEYTLMALRAVAHSQGKSGKAIAIQGICDMVEEYLGVNRDIFRRELVKNRSILDGALLMWQKKQKKTAQQFLDDDVTYEELTNMDLHYIDLYCLYPENRGSWNDHINKMTFVCLEINDEIDAEEQTFLDQIQEVEAVAYDAEMTIDWD